VLFSRCASGRRASPGLLLRRLAAQSNDRGFQTSLTLDHISNRDAASRRGRSERLTSVSAGQSLCGAPCVEPPAGIEPATPSLPSMVGPLEGQRGTSLRTTEPQVAGRIDDREMGCCEAVCGVAAGKSLARMQIIEGLAGR
jgi:hypothetical protein